MTTIRVADLSDERLELFVGLTNHQLRNKLDPERAVVIVESEIAIRTALAHGIEPLSFLLDERKLRAMEDVIVGLPDEVAVFVLEPDEAERICGFRVTRGALCAMRRPTPVPVEELASAANSLVVLEGITDTANVGAIFRNAAALGADGVIVAPSCADPLSRRAVRVSMGNVFSVGWARAAHPWPDALMDYLKRERFACLALALAPGALALDDDRLEGGGRRVLFFGCEGTGLTRAVLDRCEASVVIPMREGVDSLNVAASSAVAMWELFCRGRHAMR